jgi:DNA-binding response OmpR family regulator
MDSEQPNVRAIQIPTINFDKLLAVHKATSDSFDQMMKVHSKAAEIALQFSKTPTFQMAGAIKKAAEMGSIMERAIENIQLPTILFPRSTGPTTEEKDECIEATVVDYVSREEMNDAIRSVEARFEKRIQLLAITEVEPVKVEDQSTLIQNGDLILDKASGIVTYKECEIGQLKPMSKGFILLHLLIQEAPVTISYKELKKRILELQKKTTEEKHHDAFCHEIKSKMKRKNGKIAALIECWSDNVGNNGYRLKRQKSVRK